MPAPSNVTRIVLTGGPCAGKTTILEVIKRHFTAQGYHVFIVPEAATLLINIGFVPAAFPDDEIHELQDAILDLTLALYEQTERLVQHLGRYPALIVYDRGNLDAKAYCTPVAWNRILQTRGLNEVALGHPAYDSVIHLVTAADGAQENYSTSNNTARLENLEQAVAIDLRLRAAWEGHPRFNIVRTSAAFQGKIASTLDIIADLLPKLHQY